MRTSTFLLLALSAVTFAQPTLQSRDGENNNNNDDKSKYDWAPALEKYYQAVGKHVAAIRTTKADNNLVSSTCDLTQAVQPPSALSPPTGLALLHVALGRGTQNYTCKGKAPTDPPSQIGATASLYNATCLSVLYGDLFTLGPTAALQFPYPTSEKSSLPPSNLDLSGHHYFTDLTTPAFDLNTKADSLGFVLTKKLAGTPAPPLADGQTPIGYGNVPWLLLEAKTGTTGSVQKIYRVNTAGGSPPPNCANQPDFFEVQYAAEYWFYKLP